MQFVQQQIQQLNSEVQENFYIYSPYGEISNNMKFTLTNKRIQVLIQSEQVFPSPMLDKSCCNFDVSGIHTEWFIPNLSNGEVQTDSMRIAFLRNMVDCCGNRFDYDMCPAFKILLNGVIEKEGVNNEIF